MEDGDLFFELRKRFERDQELIRSNKEKYDEVCRENTKWLREIISKYGWPSKKGFGEKGERYAWIIVQHSDDIEFQRGCLKLLKDLPETEQRKKYIAYLTDRILMKENKKQVYGTQYSDGELYPIKDRENLDKQREKMNLSPFEEYQKEMDEHNKPN